MPAPSRGTARVSRGRRERARAMRRERASSKNEATASSERAGGKSGWSSAARREKTDNGKISPTRPKKKKKTQNTRATSTRSRSPSWRRSSTLRGSPRRSELRGREKRREGNLLLPRERERAELGRAARQALDFFLTPLPLSFLSSSPKTTPPSPKKKSAPDGAPPEHSPDAGPQLHPLLQRHPQRDGDHLRGHRGRPAQKD